MLLQKQGEASVLRMGEMMNLYEQNSTVCPNMPMRFLIYAGMVYAKYIQDDRNRINLYSSVQQKLPIPKLVCFYIWKEGRKRTGRFSS